VKKALLGSIFIFLSSITVLAQQSAAGYIESGTWVNVAPANSGFAVLMPAKPTEGAQPVEGHPDLENHLFKLDTKLGGYVVSYSQLHEDVTDHEQIKLLLDRGREGAVAKSGGEIVSESDIKLGAYFGREWGLKLPKGLTATVRAYWVKRRLYQTVFVQSPNENDSAEIIKLRQQAETKFLNSFKLSNDVSK
jgi:hypothetical protein